MPTNYGSQNLRVSTGLLNTVNDDFPGGGSLTPGLAPGQPGMRVTLGAGEIKFDSTVGTLLEGTYQYVQTLSTDTVLPPARGLLAFWSSRPLYRVTTDDTPEAELAGVFINAITPGKWGFIQAIQGGRATVQFGAADVPAAGEIASVIGDGTATAEGTASAAITAAQLSKRFGKCLTGKIGLTNLVTVALDEQQS